MRGKCRPETVEELRANGKEKVKIFTKMRAEAKEDLRNRKGVINSQKNSPLKNSTPKQEKAAKARMIAKSKQK